MQSLTLPLDEHYIEIIYNEMFRNHGSDFIGIQAVEADNELIIYFEDAVDLEAEEAFFENDFGTLTVTATPDSVPADGATPSTIDCTHADMTGQPFAEFRIYNLADVGSGEPLTTETSVLDAIVGSTTAINRTFSTPGTYVVYLECPGASRRTGYDIITATP
jgi:hypothetical protein